jgi:hypothetical protein
MSAKGSSLCLQATVALDCHEPDETAPISFRTALSSQIRLSLPIISFPSGFPTRSSYAVLVSPMRVTCPVHLTAFNKTTLLLHQEAEFPLYLYSMQWSRRGDNANRNKIKKINILNTKWTKMNLKTNFTCSQCSPSHPFDLLPPENVPGPWDQTVRVAHVTSVCVEGKQKHILCKPKISRT